MPVDKYWEFWSRRQESNLYPTLRRHVHYPLCYGEMLGKQKVCYVNSNELPTTQRPYLICYCHHHIGCEVH